MQDVSNPSADRSLHDGYRLQVAPCASRITVRFQDQTIADSADVLIMRETNHAPVYYFPRKDVAMNLLEPTDHRSHCPFKGNANYWTLHVGGREAQNVAWSYEDPFDEALVVKDHIAFYWDKMEAWLADGEPMAQPLRSEQQTTNPLVPWLIDQASRAQTTPELLTTFAEALRAADFPVWRARFMIQTLNPLLFARGYSWQEGIEGIAEFQATHAGLHRPQYQDSPFAAIFNGEGGIRRRLEGENVRLDFPILVELKAEGATDYVAVPMRFADGQINILVLVSVAPGGFSTDQLGHLYQILPNLGRLLEAHAQRTSARSLLQTYLGQGAGAMVMEGHVKRGDAEELEAIILMSDLRDSTTLAETLPKSEYLTALDDYYDCVAGAVIENGGDVLKYIGDAVLAIFPIHSTGSCATSAFDKALAALKDANRRMATVNEERQSRANAPPLKFGTGVHSGRLTFGNVGTQGRLDFTVIGSDVNKTARIASLCKTLGETVIVSKAVANQVPVSLRSLGEHQLRGIQEPQELFTLKE